MFALQTRLEGEEKRNSFDQKHNGQHDIEIHTLSTLIGQQQESLTNQQRITADALAKIAFLDKKAHQLRRQLNEISETFNRSKNWEEVNGGVDS